jgi:hypothetical protein
VIRELAPIDSKVSGLREKWVVDVSNVLHVSHRYAVRLEEPDENVIDQEGERMSNVA